MKRRKTVITLSATIFVSLVVILVLYVKANVKPNHHYASFDRKFGAHDVSLVRTLDIKYNSYYFAGNTSQHVYFGNSQVPTHILSINTQLTDTVHISILLEEDSLQYQSVQVTVDSPYFYLADGTMPFIYRGTFTDRLARPFINDLYFNKAIPLSPASFALVTLNNQQNTLEKKMTGSAGTDIHREILEAQAEGVFSTDGMLLYDRETARLLYLYYYRNQYMVMDTSLALLKRANTIDTISHARIKIGKISSRNSYTMTAPPLVVNRLSCLSGDYLYIHSNLLARNEDAERFEHESVVDVYSLSGSGGYQFSLYIPPYKGRKLRSFSVIGNTLLLALYDHTIVAYSTDVLRENY